MTGDHAGLNTNANKWWEALRGCALWFFLCFQERHVSDQTALQGQTCFVWMWKVWRALTDARYDVWCMSTALSHRTIKTALRAETDANGSSGGGGPNVCFNKCMTCLTMRPRWTGSTCVRDQCEFGLTWKDAPGASLWAAEIETGSWLKTGAGRWTNQTFSRRFWRRWNTNTTHDDRINGYKVSV